jgi:hypothetical protein
VVCEPGFDEFESVLLGSNKLGNFLLGQECAVSA